MRVLKSFKDFRIDIRVVGKMDGRGVSVIVKRKRRVSIRIIM